MLLFGTVASRGTIVNPRSVANADVEIAVGAMLIGSTHSASSRWMTDVSTMSAFLVPKQGHFLRKRPSVALESGIADCAPKEVDSR